jgi:hypothetical protein
MCCFGLLGSMIRLYQAATLNDYVGVVALPSSTNSLPVLLKEAVIAGWGITSATEVGE